MQTVSVSPKMESQWSLNFHFSYYAKCYKIIYLGPSYIFCEGIVTIAHFATLLMFLRDLFKEKFKDEITVLELTMKN